MKDRKQSGNKFEFKDEGVIFTFPKKLEYVYVESKGLPSTWPKPDNVFKQDNFVINVRLFKIEGNSVIEVNEFEEDFDIKVKFSEKHVKSAGSVGALKLAFHDGTRWVPFDENNNKREFSKKKYKKKIGKWLGYGKLKIKKKWTDPLIGWGP